MLDPRRIPPVPDICLRVCYKNWGEVAAEGFSRFLNGERELTRGEIRYHAALWNRLKEENSPLRAMVNGRILSVPEGAVLLFQAVP